MAINNWRYVVTWGYRDPSGQIVEEVQYVPNATREPDYIMNQIDSLLSWDKSAEQIRAEDGISYSPSSDMFSPAETYKFKADGYYNLWDTALGDAYSALWNWSNAYSNTAKQINDFYNQLGNEVAQREAALAWVKTDLVNQLYGDMAQQRQYVMDTFWPEGTLTKEINSYYWDLSNYLSSEAWREAAKIAAQWIHSWASLWAIRAQQNEAYNQAFERYVKAKEQEINAKQTIAGNLINYMSTLRKEYWDTTNQYIIAQYERANDLLNNLSSSIASSNAELANAKLSAATRWSGSSSGSTPMSWQDYLALQDYIDRVRNGENVEEDPDSIVEKSTN